MMSNDKIVEIQNEAQAIFTLLQQLQAPMTENNVAVLNACLGSLKLIGRMLEEEKKEAEEDAGEDQAE